jgi:outer membrane protein W
VAINDPYGEADVAGWTEGVRVGGRLKFDYFFSPFVGVGLYTSLLTYLDTFEAEGYYPGENAFLELILGLGLKVYFMAEGTFRPWFEVGVGYALTSVDMVREDDYGEYDPYGTGGSVGVEGGLGVDFLFSKNFGIGIGALIHYNATEEVESDEWYIALDPTPMSVEGALDLIFVF